MTRFQPFGKGKAAEAAAPTIRPKKQVTEYYLARAPNLHAPVNVLRVLRLGQELSEKRLVFSAIARECVRVWLRIPILRVNFFKALLESVGAEGDKSGTLYAVLIDNENRQCWKVLGKAVTLNWPKYETDGTVMHP